MLETLTAEEIPVSNCGADHVGSLLWTITAKEWFPEHKVSVAKWQQLKKIKLNQNDMCMKQSIT